MDRQEIRFLIPEELLGGLATLLPGERSRISPFNMEEPRVLSPAEISVLQSLGVVDAQGKITDQAQPALETLQAAKAFAQVRITGGGRTFQYLTYFSPQGGPTVGLVPQDEGIEVLFPANIPEVLLGLKEYTGDSFMRSCDFMAELPLTEGLALSALMDLRRKLVLHCLINGLDFQPQGYEAPQVSEAMANTPDSPQWLTPIVKLLGEMETWPTAAQIQEALVSLGRRGLVSQNHNHFMLTELPALAAERILIIDNFITLNAGREAEDGQIPVIGFTCLQSGVNDLLYLETYEEQLMLHFISASMLYGHLHHFLTDAEALKDMARGIAPAAAAVGPAPLIAERCPRCQTALSAGTKFCPGCGTPVEPLAAPAPAALCMHCGRPLKAGARFCTSCGKGL